MSNPQVPQVLTFRKSTWSDQGNCVEVADYVDASGVLVRDSKDSTGPTLAFDAAGWTAFTQGAKAGQFDL